MNQDSIELAKNKLAGCRLALFPGAFRPPHRVHFETALSLVSRPDVDQLVIIITNRCRHVPGTSKVLDTEIAEKIWSIYLQDTSGIRVEVAPHSAVKHAIGYFDRVSDYNSLLFCAGESELKRGSGRFSKIETLSQKYGIAATVIASPIPSLPGGATALRACLANDSKGYEAFIKALPYHLTAAQQEEVWQICYQGMQETRDIVRGNIQNIIERQGLGEIVNISRTKARKQDEVHCVELASGKCLFVKYANDTVKAATLGQPLSLKPRTRLYAERRALKWLAKQDGYGVKHPEIICFENISKTLILGEICPGGQYIEDDLKQAIFNPESAGRASEFLAHCHGNSDNVPPFWGDNEADRQHWENLLRLRTSGLKSEKFPDLINQNLEVLHFASRKATQQSFFHLDYCPKNIRLNGDEIGVIDFELSSNTGDPAYDFGFLLGHYLFWGIITFSRKKCLLALQTAIYRYQITRQDLWLEISPRVIAFSGATIIHCLNTNRQSPGIEKRLLDISAMLLAQTTYSDENINLIFCHIINHRFEPTVEVIKPEKIITLA